MKTNPLDVVVISAAGIDTNVYLRGADIDFSAKANFSENLDYVGGAGGYSSRGFAQLGKKTAYIGYIGDDHNGSYLADELARDGIESTLFIDPEGTRHSVNFMYRDGRRRNFYDGKGAMRVRPDMDVCRQVLSRAGLAHFCIENWARYLLAPARELGLIISCDLQDVVSPDDEYRHDFVQYADILFFSSVNFADPTGLMVNFLSANPEQVIVVGMGSRGCALGTKHGVRFFDPVPLEAPVVDTNGAGDGLAVGFLSSYYLDGYKLEDSVLRGQIAARYTCTQRADSSRMITKPQIDGYFERFRSP